MTFSQQQIEHFTHTLRQQLRSDLVWQWDDRLSVLLTEFAQNKSQDVLTILRENFEHEWNKKNIKKAPKDLKNQLGDLITLNKEQRIFTLPASDDNNPTMAAIWWPWGHGGTYSLRLMLLNDSYEFHLPSNKRANVVSFFKGLF
ncbi:hypothetical protein [Thalassotalea piscium]|uniref:Uncharacterized protein n=1 Tax=Thalassotalea piscium TaxID=1230533 RepID=A0A7X0NEU5_9GAMM|nr:hypothetical protein [Thalassotalea piscium]MBB6542105.1 hypothetical protein [Thalassotalea piscium]